MREKDDGSIGKAGAVGVGVTKPKRRLSRLVYRLPSSAGAYAALFPTPGRMKVCFGQIHLWTFHRLPQGVDLSLPSLSPPWTPRPVL